MRVLDLPTADIHVPATRARDFDPDWAEAMARMIAEQGLLQPILVRQRPKGGWWLVAGRYRLEGARANGHPTIASRISDAGTDQEAELDEIMENLGRAELIALDRCRALHRLKALHEEQHPEHKHGGDRRSKDFKFASGEHDADDRPQVFAFTKATAQKVGLSWQAISRAVKIWEDLSPASRRRLVGTPLAANQSELQLLSQQSDARQVEVLDLILDPASLIDNVRGALDHLDDGIVETAVERKFRLYCEAFAQLSELQVDHLLTFNEAAVIASLRRRGVI